MSGIRFAGIKFFFNLDRNINNSKNTKTDFLSYQSDNPQSTFENKNSPRGYEQNSKITSTTSFNFNKADQDKVTSFDQPVGMMRIKNKDGKDQWAVVGALEITKDNEATKQPEILAVLDRPMGLMKGQDGSWNLVEPLKIT